MITFCPEKLSGKVIRQSYQEKLCGKAVVRSMMSLSRPLTGKETHAMVDTFMVDTLIAACVHRVLLSAVSGNTRSCPDYRCWRVT